MKCNFLKKSILLFAILSCFYSCVNKNTITIKVKGLEPKQSERIVFYNYKMKVLDSIVVKANGTYEIEPKWEMPQVISLYERSHNKYKDFLSEKQSMTIDLKFEDGKLKPENMNMIYTSKSETLKDFLGYKYKIDSLKNSRASLDKKWAALLKKYPKRIPQEVRKPLDDAFDEYYNEKRSYIRDYVKSHHNLISMLLCLTDFRFAIKKDALKSILDKTPKDMQQYPYYKDLEKRYTILKNIEIGAIAPEIVHPDVNGKELALSSLRGKYVLLDFWASWCGPCRKENPWVKKAYKQFHKKGFDVYAVSLDYSRHKNKWIEAIKQDELPWHHVSLLKGWKDPAVEIYNLKGIPSPFLLDPQGRIIAKGDDLREEKLIETLKKIFK